MDNRTKGILAGIITTSFCTGWCACRGFDILKKKRAKNGKRKAKKQDKLPEVKMTPATPIFSDPEQGVKKVEQMEMDLPQFEEIVEDAGYSEADHDDVKNTPAPRRPYLIDEDEYDHNTIYSKRELTLYLGDGIVTDEEDEEVNNWKSLVGVEALRKIEAFGERIVFVRNEGTFEDFMITSCDGSYGGSDDD